jgi:transporter family protein
MFAVLTAIFTKIGVENVNSDFATLIRTLAISLALAGIVVGIGRWQLFGSIAGRTYLLLGLSRSRDRAILAMPLSGA